MSRRQEIVKVLIKHLPPPQSEMAADLRRLVRRAGYDNFHDVLHRAEVRSKNKDLTVEEEMLCKLARFGLGKKLERYPTLKDVVGAIKICWYNTRKKRDKDHRLDALYEKLSEEYLIY